MSCVSEMFDFIKKSPTAYHTVATVKNMLLRDGYTELYECDSWELASGGKYFVTRGGSSIIAFRAVKGANGYMIAASHSDSPAFRVKENVEKGGTYSRLDVEKYGGMIYYSWFDRPLSVAGRVVVKTEKGIKTELVNIDDDIAVIPSLAIHMNRGVNEGFAPKLNVDLYPLVSGDKSLIDSVAEGLKINPHDIVSHDLFLYNRDEGKYIGANNELV